MDVHPERKGQIEYLVEGFIVHWDEHAITVEVTDYHATKLRLPWNDLQALATIASGLKRRKPSESRPKRNPPPEV